MASLDVTATVRLYNIFCKECGTPLDFGADVDDDGDILAFVQRCNCIDDDE